MKTHFIFNKSVLMHSNMLLLIDDLLKNLFPVTVISHKTNTQKLKAEYRLQKEMKILGADKGENLRELYHLACPTAPELQYLTVVFVGSEEEYCEARALGFYIIKIKNNDLKKFFRELKISRSYQLQYLPEIQKIKNFIHYKMGYPISLYQCLHGEFTQQGVALNERSKKLAGQNAGWGNFNYIINNPGDPFFLSKSFSGHTSIFEQELIKILGQYYGLPDGTARGFVTSGGTEGNFSGLWWARNNLADKFAKKFHLKTTPIAIYFSKAAHYSIAKIAGQLGLEPHVIPINDTEQINIQAFAASIRAHMHKTPNIPIIVSANAGTIKMGAIDDVPALKKILDSEVRKKGGNYVMHLDAACLGAVLPLLQPFGKKIKNYLTELGISTIAISAHKFFGANSICGMILTTKKFLDASTHRRGLQVPYAGQIHDITPSGSRSGNNVLLIHNLFYSLDLHTHQARLKKLLHQSQLNCKYLYHELSKIYGEENVLWLDNSFCIIFPKPAEFLIRKYSLMPIDAHRVGAYGLFNLDKKLTNLFIADVKKTT